MMLCDICLKELDETKLYIFVEFICEDCYKKLIEKEEKEYGTVDI